MKTNSRRSFLSLGVLIVLFFFFSCSDDPKGTATLQVALIDGPGDFEKVEIDVLDVQINAATDEAGFESLADVNAGVFDLLKLTGGLEAILADVELPAGHVSQIRLILGDKNVLMMDGQTQDLTIPSGSESGLKLNVNVELTEGITYKILLDFDAAKSVVKAGNSGKYNLKPVIRTVVEATSGAIKGVVDPIENSVAYAIVGADTITSTYTNELGEFLFRGMEAGTYLVSIVPNTESGLTTVDKENIMVAIGEVNDLGIITLD